MKKFLYIILSAVLVAACYEDLSTLATIEYPDIIIETSEPSDTLTCAFGDDLKITAQAHQEGVDDSELSYVWEMDMSADRYADRMLLSEDNEVEFKIRQSASVTPYILSLTVTNEETGFQRIRSWSVYVTSALGEGLLVAHTRNGGVSSELDLIASQELTYGYSAESPRITRDAFGIINDSQIEGRISCMEFTVGSNLMLVPASSYNEPTISIGTDEHFYVLNPTDYSILRQDDPCFTAYTSDKYAVNYIRNTGAVSVVMIVNGRFFNSGCILDNTFAQSPSGLVDPAGVTPAVVSAVTRDQGGVAVFDQKGHKFYGSQAWNLFQSSLQEITGSNAPPQSFLSDKTCIAAGEFNGSDNIFIMKGSRNDYHAVLMNNGLNKDAETFELSAPEIAKAVSFAFCDNMNAFFYATPDKIYSSLLTNGSFSTKALSWAPDSKQEKITHVEQYLQGWYGTRGYSSYDFTLKTNRLQLIITTYNEATGEGKVYLRPYNVSTGMFTFKSNGTFGGFGEITAVTATMR